jgi:hypothetical protein
MQIHQGQCSLDRKPCRECVVCRRGDPKLPEIGSTRFEQHRPRPTSHHLYKAYLPHYSIYAQDRPHILGKLPVKKSRLQRLDLRKKLQCALVPRGVAFRDEFSSNRQFTRVAEVAAAETVVDRQGVVGANNYRDNFFQRVVIMGTKFRFKRSPALLRVSSHLLEEFVHPVVTRRIAVLATTLCP